MSNDTVQKPLTPKQAERAQAITYLKDIYLKSGDTVYVILRHVGRTGMTRYIDLYAMKDNHPMRITWNVAKALDRCYDRRREAIRIGGCGFDVGHDTVHHLAWLLFNDCDALTHSWL
ncbi:hypothetical protein OH491_19600 [Termitidicoccus mucosus]|uniref:hypothetical protein n=1 Tax=Termitidicoccus mucosus TaxID=1184151 RepID=UPI0009FC566B